MRGISFSRLRAGTSKLIRDQRGNAMMLTAAAIVPVLGMVGSGVDIGRAYMAQLRLQQACDAGVLAGRRSMAARIAAPNWSPIMVSVAPSCSPPALGSRLRSVLCCRCCSAAALRAYWVWPSPKPSPTPTIWSIRAVSGASRARTG